ncbi:phage tail tape measure protein [Streptomyces sp. NPDC004008]
MAEVADLFVTLRAETAPFTRGLGDAAVKGESFTQRMGGLGGMMSKVGKATTIAGLGIAAVSVKMAGDFQASMQKLVTTAGESQGNLGRVSAGVKSIAVQTGTGTKELADGMYMVESAGFHGAAGLNVLRVAAQGARAEQAPLPEVTNAVTSALKSYHLPASAATQITNQMIAAVGHGKMTFGEFAGSLSTVLPIAASAHLSFAQVGGAIATLTNHGTSAREATQELAFTIRSLQAPNNVAVQEMQRLGLSSNDVSTKLGQRGLTGTIDMLQKAVLSHMGPAGTVLLKAFNNSKQAAADAETMIKAMPPSIQKLADSYSKGSVTMGDWRKTLKGLPADQANLLSQYAGLINKSHGFNSQLKNGGPAAETYNSAMKKIMGGATGLNTALMLGGENAKDFNKNVTAVGKAGQHAGKDVEGWAQTQKTFNVQMGQLKERVATAAITIGTKLIPIVSSAVGFFTQHKTAAMALATVIGGVLAASVVKFATGAVVGAVKGVGDIAKGVGTAAKAVKAFATSEKLAAAATKVWEGVQAAFNLIMDANPVVLIVIGIVALVAAVVLAYNKIGWFRDFVNGAFKAIGAAIGWVVDWVKGHWPLLLAILTGPIGIAVGLIVKYWSQIKAGFLTAYHDTVNVGKALIAWISGLPGRAWSALVSLTTKVVSIANTAWTSFKEAAVIKAVALMTWVTSLPGKIKGWLGNLGSTLWNSGVSLITGFINGLESQLGHVASAASNLVSKVRSYFPFSPAKTGPFSGRGWVLYSGHALMEGFAQGIRERQDHAVSTVKSAAQATADGFAQTLGIASPSKVFRSLGIYVNEGLVDGLTGSTAKVKAATRRIESLLQETYNRVSDLAGSGKGRKGRKAMNAWVSSHEATIKRLEAYANKEDKVLRSLAAKRDSVATKIKNAQKALAAVQKQWSDEVKSVSQGVMQGFSIVTQAPQEGFALSAADVVNHMQDQYQKAATFAAQLRALQKKGLSADLVAQIAAAGVDQGGATAAALAGASKGQIAQLNSLQKATTSAADSAGKAVADSMYGAGLKSAQGLVKGLQSQQKAIEKQMMSIAKSMQRAIKKALGIHSPSRVFADIGQWIPRGLAAGVEGAAHHATRAVDRLAGSVAGAGTRSLVGAGLATAGGGGGTVVHQHFEFHIEGNVTTVDKLSKDIEAAFLRRGMRNPLTYPAYKR